MEFFKLPALLKASAAFVFGEGHTGQLYLFSCVFGFAG
jgi:hypothetical protein